MSSNHEHGCCCQDNSDQDQEKSHSCCAGGCGHNQTEILITENEAEFLKNLAQVPFLPLASFVLKSSKSSHLESVALAPVFLKDRADSMETVKSTSTVLKSLEDKGLITLDYDEPLENGDYIEYTDSALYAYFKETVEQAKIENKEKDTFLFDIPDLELGSIALTTLGRNAIKTLDSTLNS